MKKISILGILILVLVLVGCASTPKKEPSPFEGRWVAVHIEGIGEPSLPFSYLFRGNQVTFEILGGSPFNDRPRSNKFTYTETEFIVNLPRGVIRRFNYIFQDGRLITTDDINGRVTWVRQD